MGPLDTTLIFMFFLTAILLAGWIATLFQVRAAVDELHDQYLRALAALDDIATTMETFAKEDLRTVESMYAEIPAAANAKLRGFEVARNGKLVAQARVVQHKLTNYRHWARKLRESSSVAANTLGRPL